MALTVQTEKGTRWWPSMPLAIIFLLVATSSSLGQIGRGLRTAWIVFPIWLFYALLENQPSLKYLKEEIKGRRFELGSLVAWVLVVATNALLQRAYAGLYHLQTMVTLFMVVLMGLLYSSRRDGTHLLVSKVMVVILAIDVIRSLPILFGKPEIARAITGGLIDPYTAGKMALMGVGEYNLYTGLAICFPVVVALAIESKKRLLRLFLVISSIGFFMAVSLSMFMGACLLMLLGISGLGIMMFRRSSKKLKAIFVALVLACLMTTVWVGLLSKTPQVIYVLEKLERFRSSSLGTTEAQIRILLYARSLNSFLNNPWFGVGPSSGIKNPNYLSIVGGHSSWLDMPAEYGILGFGFYLAFLISFIGRVIKGSKGCSDSLLATARSISCGLFVLGGAYNPVVTSMTIMTLFHFLAESSSEFAGIEASAFNS